MNLPINVQTFEQFSQWIEDAINKKEIKKFYDILLPEYESLLKNNGFDKDFYILFINYAHKYINNPKNLSKVTDEDRRFHALYKHYMMNSPLII